MGLHDSELLTQGRQAGWAVHEGLLDSLRHLGYDHLLDLCLEGVLKKSPEQRNEVRELQFESAWRNLRWDMEPEVCMIPFTLG